MSDQGAPLAVEPSALLLASVRALTDAGREVDLNAALETFDVGPGTTVFGVVLSASGSVVLHAVHPQEVPHDARAVAAEAVAHANTRLSTSAVELDPLTGHLSVRAGIEVGDVVVPQGVLAGLLVNALHEVERAYELVVPVLEEVLDGRLSPREARTRWELPR